MNFEFSASKIAQGNIIYIFADHSFQTHPIPDHAGSIQINELELLLDSAAKIVGLSGYCPHEGWVKATLRFPKACPSSVFCRDGLDPDGIPIRFNKKGRWEISYDSKNRVICISCQLPFSTVTVVEVLQGLAFGFDGKCLCRIWVQL